MEANKKTFDFHEIKTFEDACKRLGIAPFPCVYPEKGNKESILQADALCKLLVIQKAINNGKWCDKYGWCYYPYWILRPNGEKESMSEYEKQRMGIKPLLSCAFEGIPENSGVRSSFVGSHGAMTSTDYGFPFRFNSEEAALYAAKQFEDLFFKFYGIKDKE